MGKDGLAYITHWQWGLCSFLWILASLYYGMTDLGPWFHEQGFAGNVAGDLRVHNLAQVGLFGLLLVTGSTSALASATHIYVEIACNQSLAKAVYSIKGVMFPVTVVIL